MTRLYAEQVAVKFGVQQNKIYKNGIWTCYLGINMLVLYQLSYLALSLFAGVASQRSFKPKLPCIH